jgi:hypothetical protein
LEKQFEQKLKETQAFSEEVEKQKEDNEQTAEFLQDKLDDVGKREQDLVRSETEFKLRQQGFESQNLATIEGAKRLSQDLADFILSKQQTETEFNDKKASLISRETLLKEKESVLNSKEFETTKLLNKIEKATEELNKKRKEALIPVEILEKEAANLRDLANADLQLAQKNKDESIQLRKQAKIDYNTKLSKLNNKELALEQEESRLLDLKEEMQKQLSILTKDREDYFADFDKLRFDKGQLEQDQANFITEKTKVYNESHTRLNEAENKENNAKELVKESQNIHQEAKDLMADVDSKKADLDNRFNLLDLRETDIKKMEENLANIKANTDKAVLELTLERENFAVWKNEGETLVENKAMENSRKQKLLANKEEKLRRQEKFLSDWHIRLKDERGVLDRNWQELQRKQA